MNSRGEVVGISAYWLSEVKFGLAASAVDIAPVVRKLIQGHPASGLGDRRLPAGPGAFEFDVKLQSFWDSESFVLDGAGVDSCTAEHTTKPIYLVLMPSRPLKRLAEASFSRLARYDVLTTLG